MIKVIFYRSNPCSLCETLHLNLNPCSEHTDADLWKALESAHLKEYVQQLAVNLDHEVTESRDNLSARQRQLVWLARALLLRDMKIILFERAKRHV